MDYDAFRVALGARIRTRRKELGKTQADLAHAADVSQASISAMERGTIGCTLETLFRLAEALETTMSSIVPSDAETAAVLHAMSEGGTSGARTLLSIAAKMMAGPEDG